MLALSAYHALLYCAVDLTRLRLLTHPRYYSMALYATRSLATSNTTHISCYKCACMPRYGRIPRVWPRASCIALHLNYFLTRYRTNSLRCRAQLPTCRTAGRVPLTTRDNLHNEERVANDSCLLRLIYYTFAYLPSLTRLTFRSLFAPRLFMVTHLATHMRPDDLLRHGDLTSADALTRRRTVNAHRHSLAQPLPPGGPGTTFYMRSNARIRARLHLAPAISFCAHIALPATHPHRHYLLPLVSDTNAAARAHEGCGRGAAAPPNTLR